MINSELQYIDFYTHNYVIQTIFMTKFIKDLIFKLQWIENNEWIWAFS